MAGGYDAIVVGGGHNGLVAGAYLARAGANTLIVESRESTGGAATTEAPWPDAPDIRVSRLSYVMSLMPQRIIADLSLARRGYAVTPMGPYYQAFPDGGSIALHSDPRRTREQVERWSRRDAVAMERYEAWLDGLADVLGPLLLQVPPALGSRRPADLAATLRLAWRHRGLGVRGIADLTRLLTMSIADLLDDWFTSPQVKAALALNGVIGTWAGPYSPGTAYVMIHHLLGGVGDGHRGSWGFPRGGMGAVSAAVQAAAEEFGAQVRTGSPVERVLTRNGRVVGVAMVDGREFTAPIVVTSLHPRTAFLDQLPREELPAAFVDDIERWKSRSGVVKINLALDRLPRFTADPTEDPGDHHAGAMGMAPSMEWIEQAFQDARAGQPAARPFSDGVIPSVSDPTLAPAGVHVMSLFTQWVPASWSEEPHRGDLEAYADRVITCYDDLAPGFAASVLHRDIVGPYEMEREYGLVGGNIFHGELALDQLFHLRPAPGFADYRTPIRGLYYASSATHAGGGVCGIPGWQAAHAAISDARRTARRTVSRGAG